MTLPYLKIKGRTFLIVVTAIVGMTLIGALGLQTLYRNLLEDRRDKTEQLVNAAHGLIGYYESLAHSGAMTTAEAQQAALAAVNSLRYGDAGYFWVNDMTPTVLIHTNKALIGQSVANVKDPTGLPLFQEFVRIVRAQDRGFVPYLWQKPGQQDPVRKISYVRGFQPWGWVIGTGIYLDDVDGIFAKEAGLVGGLSALVMLLAIMASALVARTLIRPIHAITAAMHHLAAGHLATEIPCTDRHDEVGEMAAAVQIFRANAQEHQRLAEIERQESDEKYRRQKQLDIVTREFSATISQLFDNMASAVKEVAQAAETLNIASAKPFVKA